MNGLHELDGAFACGDVADKTEGFQLTGIVIVWQSYKGIESSDVEDRQEWAWLVE